MKNPITEKMLRHQADRCETAKHPRCKCRCGGALHGTRHSDEWVADEVAKDKAGHAERKTQAARIVSRALQKFDPRQIDWVGYASVEQHA